MKINTIETLYEDDDVVVFNKPAGIMVHADGRSDEYTLADYVRDVYPQAAEVGEPLILEKGTKNEITVHRPGIVHRLDKETSGAIIVAKKQNIFLYLKRQFKDHEIKKVYRAIVIGRVKNDTGLIDSPLARSKSDFRLRTTVDLHTGDARGALREAITRYKVLERFSGKWNEKDSPLTLVEVYPLTGRTHQIRAHFRSIRHPLLGDTLYGPQKKKEDIPFSPARTMLHSYKISFSLPEKGQIELTAPIPPDFEEILAKNR